MNGILPTSRRVAQHLGQLLCAWVLLVGCPRTYAQKLRRPLRPPATTPAANLQQQLTELQQRLQTQAEALHRLEEREPLTVQAAAQRAEEKQQWEQQQQQLRQNEKELREQLGRLAKEREADRAATASQLAALAKVAQETVAQATGTVVRAGRFGLSLTGFAQADGYILNQLSQDELNPSTGEPLNETRFLIRRARLRAEVDYGLVGGALEFDGNTVNGAVARIIGAEVSVALRNPTNLALPYVQATLGMVKIPFGFEVIQSDRDRLFLERASIVRALFPGEYDLGLRLHGGWRFLRYALAVMNGNPAGDKQFAARDPNQSKDFVGRVGVLTELGTRLALQAGFSADYGQGFSKGSLPTKDQLVWRDDNENNQVEVGELRFIPGSAATPSQNFNRYALGGDLLLSARIPKLGQLVLYGELLWATNLDRGLRVADPVATARDLRELGYYAAITQELTPYAAVGFRYDAYNPDADATDRQAGNLVPSDPSVSTFAVAASLRYPGRARAIFEYDHNNNALGRSLSGLPARLAADTLVVRGEVTF
jgi:hypothetical protein